MAPISPAKITTGLMSVSSTSPPEIVLATWTDRKAPIRLRTAATATAVLGPERPGRDRRGHGVRRVVETVREVEGQCGHDDRDHDQRYVHVPRPSIDRPEPCLGTSVSSAVRRTPRNPRLRRCRREGSGNQRLRPKGVAKGPDPSHRARSWRRPGPSARAPRHRTVPWPAGTARRAWAPRTPSGTVPAGRAAHRPPRRNAHRVARNRGQSPRGRELFVCRERRLRDFEPGMGINPNRISSAAP